MFFNCKSLTSIDFSSFEGNKLIKIDYFLSECPNLEYIDISSFTKVLKIKPDNLSEPNVGIIKINKNWQLHIGEIYPKMKIIIVD